MAAVVDLTGDESKVEAAAPLNETDTPSGNSAACKGAPQLTVAEAFEVSYEESFLVTPRFATTLTQRCFFVCGDAIVTRSKCAMSMEYGVA